MRFLSIPVFVVLCAAIGHGQQPAKGSPTAKDLIAKYRAAIEPPKVSTPFVFKYRGQRFLYSMVDGKLRGEVFDYDASLTGHTDTPQKYRMETEMKIGIVPFRLIEVVDGESGWYQMNDSEPVVMSKGLMSSRKQRDAHLHIFLGLESFDPNIWKYSEPKGTRVRGQEVWQFEAKTAGLEPVTLSFAKQSGLLVHLKTKANDYDVVLGGHSKVESFTRDIYFSDWKKFGNRMLPAHSDAFKDSILWKQMEPVEISLPKTMDAKLFAMPKVEK